MTDTAACGLISHAQIRDALPISPAPEQYIPPKRSLAGRKVAGASKAAREAIEKAGGSIEIVERKNPAELAAAKKGSRKAAAKA